MGYLRYCTSEVGQAHDTLVAQNGLYTLMINDLDGVLLLLDQLLSIFMPLKHVRQFLRN